jgi:hypothetical protein
MMQRVERATFGCCVCGESDSSEGSHVFDKVLVVRGVSRRRKERWA